MVYWLISVPCPAAQSDGLWLSLQTDLRNAGFGSVPRFRFALPDHLKSGSLDMLVSLADDFGKLDHQLEGLTKKAERQLKELDPNAELILNRPNPGASSEASDPEGYIRVFHWNEAKFPKAKKLPELAAMIQEKLSQLDNDVKTKSQRYLAAKNTLDAYLKKDNGNLTTRDLGEVITSSVAHPSDFFSTEHFLTLLVVVPEREIDRWLSEYEKLNEGVVPRSTKRFHAQDRDGLTLWRVILKKSALEDFQRACRDQRWTAREFHYDPEYVRNQAKSREGLHKDYESETRLLIKTCKEVFSELYICLMHLKAIRVFVESVLRFSLPAAYFTFGIEPEEGRERKLQDVLIRKFMKEGESIELYQRQESDEGEDFFPFVLVPINVVIKSKRSAVAH